VAAFYSLQDTKTPALTAAAAVLANIAFSLVLMNSLGAPGLALATALASMLNGTILVTVLHRRLGAVDWRSVGRSIVRVLLACVPVAIACLWVAGAQIWMHEGQWVVKSIMLFVGIGLSVTGYVGVHALLKSDELDIFLGMVKRKLGRFANRFGGA
jgi:putative peptidoglycan lipid II flippase